MTCECLISTRLWYVVLSHTMFIELSILVNVETSHSFWRRLSAPSSPLITLCHKDLIYLSGITGVCNIL